VPARRPGCQRETGLTWDLNCSRRRCGGQQQPDCSTDPRKGPRGTPWRGARLGRAGTRGSSGSGLPLASPRHSQHRAHSSGPFAWRLRLLGRRRPTPAPPPPRPRPARRAAAPGLGGWGGGGGEGELAGWGGGLGCERARSAPLPP
jgi:hypothetical protein